MTLAMPTLLLDTSAAHESARFEQRPTTIDRHVRKPAMNPFSTALSRMGHEIRTPLNAVIGFADLMRRELHGALGCDRYREYAGHIAECGARLLTVTEQTLLLAAAAEGEPMERAEPVCLTLLVGLALETVAAGRLAEHLDIVPTIDPAIEVPASRSALRYAIANLIAGAARGWGEAGRLDITSTTRGCQTTLVITLQPVANGPSGTRTLGASDIASDGHVAIARQLLRLQGLSLTLGATREAPWSAEITFEEPSQLELL